MCHGLFWVFDFLLVLICFLVFVLKCRASLHIASYLCTFPAIQVFAVWCAVCCLCFFNRLRLNFPSLPNIPFQVVAVLSGCLPGSSWSGTPQPSTPTYLPKRRSLSSVVNSEQILPTSEPIIRNTLRKALRAEEKWNLAEFLGATFSHQSLFGDVFWVCLCFLFMHIFVYASLYVCLSV